MASSAAPNEGSSSSVPRPVFVCLNFLVKKGPLQNKILIPFLLHFLKATDLRSTKQKKLSKSVHWFKSYSTFCTRNWSFFPGFQYKGLLRSDGTKKDFFRNKLKKTEIISCIKKKNPTKLYIFIYLYQKAIIHPRWLPTSGFL